VTAGDSPISAALAMAAFAVVPLLLLTVTAFLRISVVLGLLRSGLGTPEIPSTPVLTGVALVLSLVVMLPVAEGAWRDARGAAIAGPLDGPASWRGVLALTERAREPYRAFLHRHASARDRALFLELSRKLRAPDAQASVAANDLAVLAPAFVTSELSVALRLGLLLLIPFLVIDLVVANVMLALGLHTVSPASVALPLKLLLFVAVDGWQLVARGLIAGFAS
jgi:type III secretion protein R